ncbi:MULTISPECIES: hypothetical protein [unclassified Ensifer]|uniref:hypothetical protein n=1 Tax=unclassified Ensifer TaxID=2633371 RepID=UPI000813701D|nr:MULTISPECIES: hypothetical protein [unclassified Ensifer]OCP21946.1 hypothetical protein BC361_25595 [Ensifer sp. LC54]OCP23274.1 hypothetical protein BC363_25170 [Ensifer sp. LC384]
MGVWRYCGCGQGTSFPDAEEHIQGFQSCANCGKEVPVHEDERRRFFLEMHERLVEVERQMKLLVEITKKVARKTYPKIGST